MPNRLKCYTDLICYRVQHPSAKGEKHHILPRCMGGWEDGNLVRLSAREHFIAHALLARAFPEDSKIVFAFWGMCNQKNEHQQRTRPSSRLYEMAKIARAKHISTLLKGRKFSDETRAKMSAAAKKRTNPCQEKGKPKSPEHRKKISEAAKRRPLFKCVCGKEGPAFSITRWHRGCIQPSLDSA